MNVILLQIPIVMRKIKTTQFCVMKIAFTTYGLYYEIVLGFFFFGPESRLDVPVALALYMHFISQRVVD